MVTTHPTRIADFVGRALPELTDRRRVLALVAASAEAARGVCPNAVCLSLRDDTLRLNVGMLEVIVLSEYGLRVNFAAPLGTPPFVKPRFERSRYERTSHAGRQCAYFGPPAAYDFDDTILIQAHQAFIRGAGLTKSGRPVAGSPHMKAHDPAILKWVRDFLTSNKDDSTERSLGDTGVPSVNDRLFPLSETERQAVIKARICQGRFRDALLQRWRGRCAVTGASTAVALIASHIKPWADSTSAERQDPDNGLLLVATLDRLFDGYLISFDDEGKILVSAGISAIERQQLQLSDAYRLRELPQRTGAFLEGHRREFQRRAAQLRGR